MNNLNNLNKLEVHPLASLFPSLSEREQRELEKSIDEIGLQEEITLYGGKILDGVHRNNACIKVGVQPMYKNLPDGISAEAYVVAKNLYRRHLNPAQKVNVALEFREKKHEKENNEKILIEKLKKENKDDILIQNALMVRETKENEKIAKLFGTKLESVRQGIVIKNKAKKDPKIAADWEAALKGQTTIEAVYNKIISKKRKGKKKENKSKLGVDALHDVTEQKRILTDNYSILFQKNQLIQEKYDRLVFSLKKILTSIKNDDSEDIGNKYKQLIEKLGNLIDEINNPQKQKLFFTPIEDLRKAELKIN